MPSGVGAQSLHLTVKKQITAVTDLTFGDAGKGVSVQRLVGELNSKLVLRCGGGAQCAHTVMSPGGATHTFSQFGSASFLGAKTFYGPRAYFNPIIMSLEADKLDKKGVPNPKSLFYVHEDCLVTTPYHRALNRLRELARKDNIHGSCGIGIGETARIALESPDIAIRVKDLLLPNGYLSIYYEDLNKLMWSEVKKLKGALDVTSPLIREEVETFKIEIPKIIEKTKKAIEGITILTKKDTHSFLCGFDQIVAEGNQGVLLDENYGFHPYTTWSKTTSENVYALAAEYELPHEIKDYGVIRTFLTRHGPGPFPSENTALTEKFAEVHNTHNQWQRGFRFGYFDTSLINYAISVNKGIDGLIVTHCDWLNQAQWCEACGYDGSFQDIPILKYPDLRKQEEITNLLLQTRAVLHKDALSKEEVLARIAEVLNTKIVMSADGPEYQKYQLHENV